MTYVSNPDPREGNSRFAGQGSSSANRELKLAQEIRPEACFAFGEDFVAGMTNVTQSMSGQVKASCPGRGR